MKINHSKPYFDDSDKNAVISLINSHFSACGPMSEKLGFTAAEFMSKKYGIAVQSGTDALTSALSVLGLKQGARIALPAYICSAPLDAVALCGFKPVPVDIDLDTFAISAELLEKEKDIDAVIGAHLFGIPANLQKITHENFIEDCAQTLCTAKNGRKVGATGRISITSFYSTKLVAAGHGGVVAVNEKDLYNALLSSMNHDKNETWKPHFHFLMSDLNAALGLAQCAKIDFMIERRRTIAGRFAAALDCKLPDNNSVYSRFLVTAECGIDKGMELFQEAGIEAKRPVYKPLFHYLNLPPSSFQNAQWAHDNIISVPIYPALTETEVEYIENFLEKHKNVYRCRPSA